MSSSAPTPPPTSADAQKRLFGYVLQLADTSLLLAHRLSEWCGHGPVLEQDLALANIALDLLGEARSYYQYAAELEGQGCTEDDLAYLRSAVEYRNPLLVEQPNGDFAHTIMRQFLYDTFHYHLLASVAALPRCPAGRHCREIGEGGRLPHQVEFGVDDSAGRRHRRKAAAAWKKPSATLWRYAEELTTPTSDRASPASRRLPTRLRRHPAADGRAHSPRV